MARTQMGTNSKFGHAMKTTIIKNGIFRLSSQDLVKLLKFEEGSVTRFVDCVFTI
jgi:hypothetical protein